MRLTTAPDAYNKGDQQSMRRELETADMANFKKGQDVRLQNGERLILKSPNGTLYYLKVANDGTLSTGTV